MAEKAYGQVESVKDFDDSGVDPVQARWCAELKIAREYYEKYFEKCKKIVKSYRDERSEETSEKTRGKRLNLLWSNTQTLQPAVLSQRPKAVVARRNNDSDPTGLIASMILERCIDYTVDSDEFDDSLFQARDDYLLLGRGALRAVFTADSAETSENTPIVKDEKITIDYLMWDDYLVSPARVWSERRWEAYRVYMNRDQLVKRFGKEKGKKIPLTHTSDEAKRSLKDEHELSLFKQAEIWEIWSLDTREIFWICEQADEPCDVKADFLGLTNFFPAPRPAFGTKTNNTTIPVPDYVLYRDQARAIDAYETRIQSLRNALRVRGFYNAEIPELERLYREASDNDLIPIANWSMFQQAGGAEGSIVFVPIKEIVAAIIELSQAIEQEKQRIYEVTGISDIIRGASNPNETATAQQLKGQFGTLRLESKRREINRLARGALEIIGEIIAEHYSTETIIAMADVEPVPPPPPQLDPQTGQPMQAERPKLEFPKVYQDELMQAIDLLRNDKMRKFRIDIETDSTIASDEQADKQAANEMITAVGGFMLQAMQVVQQAPSILPVISEMLLFMVRKYRAGRSLEGVIEQSAGQLRAAAENAAKNPPPNPEMMKVQASAERDKSELALKDKQNQATLQLEQQKNQGQLALEKYKADVQAQSAVAIEQHRGKIQLANARMTKMADLEHNQVDEEGQIGPSPLMQQMTQIEAAQKQSLEQIAQIQLQTMQIMQQMLVQLSAPKRVVRDQTGAITGVETMQQPAPTLQ